MRNEQPITKKQRKASRFYCEVVRPLWKTGQQHNENRQFDKWLRNGGISRSSTQRTRARSSGRGG